MVSGKWEENLLRIGQKFNRITHNTTMIRDSTQALMNLVRVHSRNIHRKFEANLCISLREEVKYKILQSDIL